MADEVAQRETQARSPNLRRSSDSPPYSPMGSGHMDGGPDAKIKR